jgi:hypothetical protein
MGDVPLIDAETFLQCGRPANIPPSEVNFEAVTLVC